MFSLVELIDVDVATGDLCGAGHGDDYLTLKESIPPHTTTSPSRVNTASLQRCNSAREHDSA